MKKSSINMAPKGKIPAIKVLQLNTYFTCRNFGLGNIKFRFNFLKEKIMENMICKHTRRMG